MISPPENPEPNHPGSPEDSGAGTSGLKRRWLLNAGLLALIAALAWIAIYLPGQKKEVSGSPLTALSADAVSQIRIEKPGQPVIVLEKTGGSWMLTEPLKARANRFNVEGLLRMLSAPGEIRFPAVAPELSKFGLDTPQARVWFENEAIAFGVLHPLKNQTYVLYKNEVVLIPGYHLAAATYPYTNFISSRLFEEDRKLTALKLPDFTLTLKDGIWRRQPPDEKLTSDRINDFASEWQNARALTVEKYSGKAAVDAIEIASARDGTSETLMLDILAYRPDFILHRRDENLEYHFTEETGKRLLSLAGKE